MDAKSELLLRSAAHFQGKVLLAGLPADDLLAYWPQAHGWSWQMQDFAPLSQRFGARCGAVFGSTSPPAGLFDAAVLFLPKSREQTDYLLQNLAARLPGKPLYLVGEKRAGIERAAKQLQAFGHPQKLDSARHCQLWRVGVEQSPKNPHLAYWAKWYDVPLAGGTLEVTSLPGVFAHGRLDAGTALLLEYLDGLPRGALLDFGCGAGIIGAALARRYPKQAVILADSCAFALQSASLTLASSGFDCTMPLSAATPARPPAGEGQGERVSLLAVSGIADAPKDFAAIVSNPPFHQGVATRYQVSEDLLREAPSHLKPGGELRLVANVFLRYPSLLQQYFGHCEVLSQRGGFQVLRAVKVDC